MNKLTNQEILKVFALYIGCPCAIFDDYKSPEEWSPAEIEGVDIIAETVICERCNFLPRQVKLIIKPLDVYGKDEVKTRLIKFIMDHRTLYSCMNIVQYMLNECYDLPLCFGPDHWGNGKTVFDLELAIPDREYLWELAKKTLGFEVDKLQEYASELKLNIDKLPGMLKLIELLEKMKL